jgi:hypothetical protein
MPIINIAISKEDHQKLLDEHQSIVNTWPQRDAPPLPPTFDQWLGARVMAGAAMTRPAAEFDDIRAFDAIEKLVTSLHQHGFGLAHVARQGVEASASAQQLAQAMTTDLKLDAHYQKRLTDLFEHYLKSAKEIADAAQIGITKRAYGSISEAYRQLADRTAKAAAHLGDERALGRVEGGVAVLVGVNVMDRAAAKEKTDAFKLQLSNTPTQKASLVDKMFGRTRNTE